MKKRSHTSRASKDLRDSGMLPEYDFSKGVRGNQEIRVWAPLIGFHWTGSERQIVDDTWVRPGSTYRDYEEFSEFKYWLSEGERDQCRATKHWLALTYTRTGELSASAKINSFLLALWIVKPTQTRVPFRFEASESNFRLVARVLDRFQWVEEQAEDEVKDHDLEGVRRILAPLRAVYVAHRRLRNALALTFRGCVASDWQTAFICLSAAVEALLTNSVRPGLPNRLAASYVKLIGATQADCDRFKRLYSVRSNIVHGRAYDRAAPGRNLKDLAEFSDILRQLWRVVLESEEVRTALEGTDRQRKNFFNKLLAPHK